MSEINSTSPVNVNSGSHAEELNPLPKANNLKDLVAAAIKENKIDTSAIPLPVLWDKELKVFGVESWKKYLGFEVEGKIPELPSMREVYLTSHFLKSLIAKKSKARSCSLILMPKGLTANKLIALMKSPKKGHSTELANIWGRIEAELGEKEIKESYLFVMTNDVIDGSRNKSYADQKKLVQEKTNGECVLPTYLEQLVCCVMHHVIDGEHLLGREEITFSRCQDLVDCFPVVVGGSGGLFVYYFNVFAFVSVDDGAVACRKFC